MDEEYTGLKKQLAISVDLNQNKSFFWSTWFQHKGDINYSLWETHDSFKNHDFLN